MHGEIKKFRIIKEKQIKPKMVKKLKAQSNNVIVKYDEIIYMLVLIKKYKYFQNIFLLYKFITL